jgi:hypothetical protein
LEFAFLQWNKTEGDPILPNVPETDFPFVEQSNIQILLSKSFRIGL